MLSLDRQNRYRERYKQIRAGWRPSGEVYENRVRQILAARRDHHRLAVLDLGCGSGGLIELLSREVGLPVGVDRDLASLRRHRDPLVQLAGSDLARLPFAGNTFDLAISSWVLEHVEEPRTVLAEVARVLKPGGSFVFLTPNAASPVTLLNRAAPRLMQSSLVEWFYGRHEEDVFPVVYRANTVAAIAGAARSAGLRLRAAHLIDDPTYLAFNDLLFRACVLVARVTPRKNAVHLVGELIKES